MPRPGGRPAAAVKACTSGSTDSRIAAATAWPSSRSRAHLTSIDVSSLTVTVRCTAVPAAARSRADFQLAQASPARPEHDEVVSRLHRRVGCRVELHAPVGALDADHDDAEALAQVGLDDRAAGERRARRRCGPAPCSARGCPSWWRAARSPRPPGRSAVCASWRPPI